MSRNKVMGLGPVKLLWPWLILLSMGVVTSAGHHQTKESLSKVARVGSHLREEGRLPDLFVP